MSATMVSSSSSGRNRTNRTGVEMLAVLLLGIGSVATAWCGLQASRWNGEEDREARDAGISRTEASEAYALGTQLFSYDANSIAQYAGAVASGNERLQTFIRENLVRPGFRPVLDQWKATIAAGDTPTNLFADQTYLDSLFAESTAISAESDSAMARSGEASDNADDYLIMTLLTATALFFAGVTTSFASRSARLALIAVAGTILAFTAARLIDLPVV
jgi:hypothetical protein